MNRLPKPLAEPMDKLLAYKNTKGLIAELAKRMSVGIYGKLGQMHKDGLGKHFNSCWFAEISTQVRLKVAEWLYTNDIGPEHSDKLLHISVDGCLLSEPIKGFKKTKTPMSQNGQWKLNSITPALIISSGLVYLVGRKPKGLKLEEILEAIKAHPRQGYYEWKVVRRVTLADALSQGKFSELGQEKPHYSSIDLYRIDRDRLFSKTPTTGYQLLNKHYSSKPKKALGLMKLRE